MHSTIHKCKETQAANSIIPGIVRCFLVKDGLPSSGQIFVLQGGSVVHRHLSKQWLVPVETYPEIGSKSSTRFSNSRVNIIDVNHVELS